MADVVVVVDDLILRGLTSLGLIGLGLRAGLGLAGLLAWVGLLL